MKMEKYDVIIAGGGTAGAAAAIGAVQAGARTLLLERDSYLGGEAAHAGVGAFCGLYTCGDNPRKCVSGAADMVIEEMERLNPRSVEWIISAAGNRNLQHKTEYLKIALDNILKKLGVDVLLHTVIVGADTAGGMLKKLICADDEGMFAVTADAFVDATGDANVAHLSGAATLWGDREGRVQAATLPFRLCNVDITKDMSPAAVERAVKAGKEAGILYMTREKGFIQKITGSTEVLVLLPSVIPTGLTAREVTAMEQEARRQVISYVEAFRKFMPGMENCELTMIGPSIGFRETRRIVGRQLLTAEDVLQRRKYDHSVARGGWKPEIHLDLKEAATYLEVPGASYYSIPLGSLQSRDLDNLYGCGRLVYADSPAMAAVRVMGTCFATGQAAGVAAAVQSRTGAPDIAVIRQELLRQKAMI